MAPQIPEQPRLDWESASPDQQEPISALDEMVRGDPQTAISTLDLLLNGPEGTGLDERQQEISQAVGTVLDVTDTGKRLRGLYDETTFTHIIDHPEYEKLLQEAREQGTPGIDRRIACFGLYIYAQRIVEDSASGEVPVLPAQPTENQTDRIAA